MDMVPVRAARAAGHPCAWLLPRRCGRRAGRLASTPHISGQPMSPRPRPAGRRVPASGGPSRARLRPRRRLCRLLTGIATVDSETAWIGMARGRTVRGFEAFIREFKIPPPDVFETPATFGMRCPRHVLRLWHDSVELARRIAGAQLTRGQAAEAIAAEGLSARPVAGPEPTMEETPPPPADPDERRCVFSEDLDWTPL